MRETKTKKKKKNVTVIVTRRKKKTAGIGEVAAKIELLEALDETDHDHHVPKMTKKIQRKNHHGGTKRMIQLK